MKKLLLPILLVLLLLAAVCAMASTPTVYAPTSAAVKVAADPLMNTTQAVPPFDIGRAVVACSPFACADRGSPWTCLDTRTGTYTSATSIVATTSPPRDALVATTHMDIVVAADSPPRHEVAIARMDYGRCTQS